MPRRKPAVDNSVSEQNTRARGQRTRRKVSRESRSSSKENTPLPKGRRVENNNGEETASSEDEVLRRSISSQPSQPSGHDDNSSEESEDTVVGSGADTTADEDTANNTEASGDEIDHVTFMKEYTNLIKAAKRLGDNATIADDFEEGNTLLIGNVEKASVLAQHIGSDPSKAITAFTHTLAITETANLSVKKCGNVSSLFSIEKYLDVLKNLGTQEDGEIDTALIHKALSSDLRRCSFQGHNLTSLVGVVNITSAEPEVVPEKKKRAATKRANFDETAPATQHEVVNSQVRRSAHDSEKDSITESLRKAAELKKVCVKTRKPAIGLIDYGLRKPENIQSFVSEVFSAAVLTRDGCARVFCDESDSQNNIERPKGGIPNEKILVQAAKPPDVSEEGFELNRTQHIVSLNAKTIREMIAKGMTPFS